MIGHPTHDYDDQAASDRLRRHQHDLNESLAGILDVEAGLREVLIQSLYDTALAGLEPILNSEVGLADIISPTPRPRAPHTSAAHHPSRAGHLPHSFSPADRMALRDYPDVKAAQRALALARDLARDLAFDRALALGLARDLALDLNHALARDLALASDHDHDLDHACTLNLALTRALDRDRDLTRSRALALALSREFALVHDHDHDHDHGCTLARGRARAYARDLARILDVPLGHDTLMEVRAHEVCRAIGFVLHREPPALDAASVSMLLNDFTQDDLRGTDLTGIDLSGMHWSQCTQWPPVVDVEALKARSYETVPGSGIWVVRPGTTTVRDFADLT